MERVELNLYRCFYKQYQYIHQVPAYAGMTKNELNRTTLHAAVTKNELSRTAIRYRRNDIAL